MSAKRRATKAAREEDTRTPEQREVDAILGALGAAGVNVPHLMGQLLPMAQFAALLGVLCERRVIAYEDYDAELARRLVGELRAAQLSFEKQRKQAEGAAVAEARALAVAQAPGIIVPGRFGKRVD